MDSVFLAVVLLVVVGCGGTTCRDASDGRYAETTHLELKTVAEGKHDTMWDAFVEAVLLPLAKKGHMKIDLEVPQKHFDYISIGLNLDDVCTIGKRNGIVVERITFQKPQTVGYGPRGGSDHLARQSRQ